MPIVGRLAAADSSEQIRLGCQTNAWPIHPAHSETLFQALADIKTIGFTGFETGFANVLPLANRIDEFKRHTQGLAPFGIHIFLTHYDPATCVAPPELIDSVAELGSKAGFQHLILSGASATDESVRRQKTNALNLYGKQVNRLGMKLAYHNHGPEFQSPHPEIEYLLGETDPSLVSFLLDAGHAFHAGADILSFIERHCNRLAGLHLRDYRAGNQVPLGEGEFPLPAVAGILRRLGWSGWALAEEERLDGTKLGNNAAAPAIAALRKAFEI